MIASLNGLAELGDQRAFEVGFSMTLDKNRSLRVRSAATAIVGAAGKGDPRAYPVIFGQFKKAFDVNNIEGILSGIRAIIKIADPRGQEAFDMLKAKYKSSPEAMAAIGVYESEFKAAIKN